MTALEQLEQRIDDLTDRWLDAICKGTPADAAAAAEAVHRAEDALRAERRRLQAAPVPAGHTEAR